jgi:hypothetical protein
MKKQEIVRLKKILNLVMDNKRGRGPTPRPNGRLTVGHKITSTSNYKLRYTERSVLYGVKTTDRGLSLSRLNRGQRS